MKVLHLNTSDGAGGAARAAQRIHRSLLGAGVDSLMLVQQRTGTDSTVRGPGNPTARLLARAWRHLEQFPLRHYPRRAPAPWSSCLFPNPPVMRQIRAMAPDLLHLHWVGNGFIPIAALPRFGLPVVWTMHDMWPFTGGCHYADDCRRFTDACGHCPRLRSARNHDLSRRILAAKKRRWPLGRMVMVSPSHWLAGCARESALLRGATIRVVPNPIDTRLYRPLDRAAARSHLDWPLHDPIILVGSVSRSDDRRKGLDLLLEALPRVAARLPRCCLAVFGAASGTTQVPSSLRVLPVGHLQDDLALALVYTSADLVVTPSREDNLPNVMVEALACGTPVVAFRLGGFPDLIEDRVNGCLVTPFDAAGLAEAIVWSLTQADPQALREKACHRARQHCAPEVVAAQYRALYQELDAAAGFLP